MRTRLCEQFGIDFPIFAFSHCRDVVAAVSRAGGFGVLGALAFSPEQLEVELRWIDAHVGGKPYGVDVVMPMSYAVSAQEQAGVKIDQAMLEQMLPARHREYVEDVLRKFDVPPLPADEPPAPGLLGWTHGGARSQVEIALAHPIKLLVNALGPPPPDVVERAHRHGVKVAALIGSGRHAQKQVEAGVDIIVAQGTEAGGHTGDVSTMVLVPEVVDAVHPTPVLAAGGIGTGRQIAAALALGADGVWTGSIWLTVAEADTPVAARDKLLHAGSRDTVRSRSMTGKPARQLRTAWTDAWDGPESPGTLPMPLQFLLTADAIHRINRAANNPRSPSRARELVGMPVGQIVGRMNTVRPTRDVMRALVEEYVEAVSHVTETLPEG